MKYVFAQPAIKNVDCLTKKNHLTLIILSTLLLFRQKNSHLHFHLTSISIRYCTMGISASEKRINKGG